MKVDDLIKNAKTKLYKDKIDHWQNQLVGLYEKRTKAQEVLDNIDREIKLKEVELNDKIESLMSCKIPGVSGDSSKSE